ncbi:MAG: prevent-host-death protein [Dysgonamonadaceae bacterium]|jgi:antitoxin (DNA-binding transcriptional repressor) of toxin-antitoxin stability system|nr:prevent-host-death protein [Dysgonamonadaceae bacterium]
MLVISSREFRNNQARYLDRIDEGAQIVVQRGKSKSYSIHPITDSDLYFTPEVIKKIDRAMAQAERGEGVVCKTYEESLKFLESL